MDGGVESTLTIAAGCGGDEDTVVLLGIIIFSGRGAIDVSCFTGVAGTTCCSLCGCGGDGTGRAGIEVETIGFGAAAATVAAACGVRLGIIGAEQRGCFLGRCPGVMSVGDWSSLFAALCMSSYRIGAEACLCCGTFRVSIYSRS